MYPLTYTGDLVAIYFYVWNIEPGAISIRDMHDSAVIINHTLLRCSVAPSYLLHVLRYMAGLHNGSLPFWSVFCFIHARVGVCYEVSPVPPKAPGVQVC